MKVLARDGKRPAGAFALAELLVVIAILTLLAAILLPGLARAKETSRATECIGNLGQWGMAFRMYTDDNADYLPRRGQGVQVLFEIDRPEDWFNALPVYFGLLEFQRMVAVSNQPVAH